MTSMEAQPAQRRSAWPFVAKAAVSLLLLWLPLRHVDLATVLRDVAGVDLEMLFGALLVLLLTTFVAAFRWSVILHILGMPRGVGVTYPLSLVGLFFGQALPAGVGGDIVRIWLGCKTGLSVRLAISSILGDRLTGLLAILVIVTVELPVLRQLGSDQELVYGLLGLLVAGYAGFAVLLLLDRLPATLHRLPLAGGFVRLSADMRLMLLRPGAGLPVLLCGVAVQLGNVVAVFALARGLQVPIGVGLCLLVVPLSNLLQSLPISIAGWGIRESFFVAAFGMVGVATPQALAISVIFGLLIMLSSLPGGLVWLAKPWGSLQTLREAGSSSRIASAE